MVKTNGLDSRDPDFNDYGYSDFVADYKATDEQLEEWLSEDPMGAIKAICKFVEGEGILEAAWVIEHEEEIEAEWDGRGDEN
jgi:TPP-dependent pyruvate/acetoin dehydrogenase alpha subunit